MARVTLRIQPGAPRDAVVGRVGQTWKIAVAAPPVEGRANRACAAFLSKLLKRPRSDVELIVGAKSRTKTFEIAGTSVDEIESSLTEAST